MVKEKKQKISVNNLKKAIRYCGKNGFCHTFYAVLERLQGGNGKHYVFTPVSRESLAEQKRESKQNSPYKFSVVVPAYETKAVYLKEMINSVINQSYSNLELIITDASSTDVVKRVVDSYKDKRICYKRLQENKGISENTKEGLELATGDYVALLDHDDVLTLDALHEMKKCIEEKEKRGISPAMVYSDEDKGDGELKRFFEPHYKESFNLDLFLSNNYICHFTAVKTEIIKELGFRKEYDGAQDYDLFLRIVAKLAGKADERIAHIPKILYHWRCHTDSTAENPASKMYAYEAGRKAVLDFANQKGWNVTVEHSKHLGFYRILYPDGIFATRKEIAAIGGPIIQNGKIAAGFMKESGTISYKGLNKHFSGYMHRAVLQQDAQALDPANMKVREEWKEDFEKILKKWKMEELSNKEDTLERRKKAGIEFGKLVRKTGGILYYDPYYEMGREL